MNVFSRWEITLRWMKDAWFFLKQNYLSLSVSSFPEFAFSLLHTYVHLLSFVFYLNHTHTNILTLFLNHEHIIFRFFTNKTIHTVSLSLSLSLSLVHPLSYLFSLFSHLYLMDTCTHSLYGISPFHSHTPISSIPKVGRFLGMNFAFGILFIVHLVESAICENSVPRESVAALLTNISLLFSYKSFTAPSTLTS
jgi:hypothetical protein